MIRPKPVVLCILDGWGLRADSSANAVALANTPTPIVKACRIMLVVMDRALICYLLQVKTSAYSA